MYMRDPLNHSIKLFGKMELSHCILCARLTQHPSSGWPRHRENRENREFGSYFFQTGNFVVTQGKVFETQGKYF